MTTESWSHVVADPLPFAKLLGLELLTITPDRVAPVQRSPPRPAAFQPLRSLTRRPRRATPVGALSQARYLALAPSVVQTTDVLEQQLDLLAQAIAKGTSATQHMALHRRAETLTYLQRLQEAAATYSTVMQQWPDDQHARLGLALITAMRQATADAAAADQALAEALALAFAPTSTRPSPLTPQTALTWLQQALPGDPCVADIASVLMVSSGMMLQRGAIALALAVLTPLYALLAQPQ